MQAPDPTWSSLPHRQLPTIKLTEGSHQGYALQWFTLATVLALGYPLYLRHTVALQHKELGKEWGAAPSHEGGLAAPRYGESTR